jgi:hypothetical protein
MQGLVVDGGEGSTFITATVVSVQAGSEAFPAALAAAALKETAPHLWLLAAHEEGVAAGLAQAHQDVVHALLLDPVLDCKGARWPR